MADDWGDLMGAASSYDNAPKRTGSFDHHKFAAEEAGHHRVRKYNPTRARQAAMRANRIRKGTLRARGSS